MDMHPGGGGGPHREGGGSPGALQINIDQAIQAAIVARPGHTVQAATLPTKKRRAWKIEFSDESPAIVVDAVSAAVSPAPPEPPHGDPISNWMRQSHEGEGYGPIWKWIAFLTGFAPTILAISGIVLWLTRRGRRRRLKVTA